MQLTDEEKVQWFKDTIGPIIGQITKTGDRVEEIVVVDELYETASDALSEIDLPADFPDQPNITREQLANDFRAYCNQIMIRTATIDHLAVPDETIPPELIFIRPITSKMRINGFIDSWDRSVGFTEGLKQIGCSFDFAPEEKKLLFGFAHLMNCISQQAARQNSMHPGQVNMFKAE